MVPTPRLILTASHLLNRVAGFPAGRWSTVCWWTARPDLVCPKCGRLRAGARTTPRRVTWPTRRRRRYGGGAACCCSTGAGGGGGQAVSRVPEMRPAEGRGEYHSAARDLADAAEASVRRRDLLLFFYRFAAGPFLVSDGDVMGSH